tara:strand:- start:91 stop:585 length:495 start_codon:yes stop_codon:yes gene_type:complete
MDKNYRGNASQFFIAGELCRRGYSAVVTLGNTPNTDILCSNLEGTKFVHIQVKTFVPTNKTCSIGVKAEKNYGENFIWVLGGIPKPDDVESEFIYYIIPSPVLSEQITQRHQNWMDTPARDGSKHNETNMRTVDIPPYKNRQENLQWDITPYKNRWDLICEKLD